MVSSCASERHKLWVAYVSTMALASTFASVFLLCALSSSSYASERVNVSLYYESLCPFCRAFIEDTLWPLYDGPVGDIMDLKLVPYGNVHRLDGRMVCQHGEEECRLNKLEACALEEAEFREAFAFVACIEEDPLVYVNKTSQCASNAGIQHLVSSITACSTGKKGESLFKRMGEKTDSLRPPHQFVPWVTVNGIPIQEDYENLKTFVCAAYTSGRRPDECYETKERIDERNVMLRFQLEKRTLAGNLAKQ